MAGNGMEKLNRFQNELQKIRQRRTELQAKDKELEIKETEWNQKIQEETNQLILNMVYSSGHDIGSLAELLEVAGKKKKQEEATEHGTIALEKNVDDLYNEPDVIK